MPWYDDLCVLTHRVKQRAYRVWSRSIVQNDFEEHRGARHHAQRVYVEAERVFNELSKALLTNAPNSRNWCSTIKTAVFSVSSRLPLVVDRRGR